MDRQILHFGKLPATVFRAPLALRHLPHPFVNEITGWQSMYFAYGWPGCPFVPHLLGSAKSIDEIKRQVETAANAGFARFFGSLELIPDPMVKERNRHSRRIVRALQTAPGCELVHGTLLKKIKLPTARFRRIIGRLITRGVVTVRRTEGGHGHIYRLTEINR